MIHAAIDHLVVTAPSLDAGSAYIRAELGAEMQPGGRHARMGTHNTVLRLGDSTYLEVLAVDPAARRPEFPRWFGLDDMRDNETPRLAAWVARVDDIHEAVAAVPALGEVKTMSRGTLTWMITIPAEGATPTGGVMPVLIQWLDGEHPADNLGDSGCTLTSLRGVQSEAGRLNKAFSKFHLEERWALALAQPGEKQGLVATIQTATGLRTLQT